MGTILKNILSFTGLVVGVPVSVPHLLNVNGTAVKPQLGGVDAAGFTVVADTVNVTVTRTTAATSGDVGVYIEHWHTIEDVTPPGGLDALTPFFFATGGGGGGGGGSPQYTLANGAVAGGTLTSTNANVVLVTNAGADSFVQLVDLGVIPETGAPLFVQVSAGSAGGYAFLTGGAQAGTAYPILGDTSIAGPLQAGTFVFTGAGWLPLSSVMSQTVKITNDLFAGNEVVTTTVQAAQLGEVGALRVQACVITTPIAANATVDLNATAEGVVQRLFLTGNAAPGSINNIVNSFAAPQSGQTLEVTNFSVAAITLNNLATGAGQLYLGSAPTVLQSNQTAFFDYDAANEVGFGADTWLMQGATTSGGGGGGAPQMTISRFRPADFDTVALVANAVNVIDCQDITLNVLVQLPLSGSSPAGTPLEVAFVNLSAEADPFRGQFVGIGQQPTGLALAQVATSGVDTLNGVPGGASASFIKLSDGVRFVCDGALDWIATSASWYNAALAGLSPGAGNQQLSFVGAVPSVIGIAGLAGNTTVIQAISAGYFGQTILIVNGDLGGHTFKLQPGFGGVLTGNNQPLLGIAAGYTLAVGSMRMLQYNPDLSDATLGKWYVIGDA